jgi:hypothetical protein
LELNIVESMEVYLRTIRSRSFPNRFGLLQFKEQLLQEKEIEAREM